LSLNEQLEKVRSKEDLAEFITALCSDLRTNARGWENATLERFLDAAQAWIRDMDGYYRNSGQEPPDVPSWRTFAEILSAARSYE
jgi:hypothetical protein